MPPSRLSRDSHRLVSIAPKPPESDRPFPAGLGIDGADRPGPDGPDPTPPRAPLPGLDADRSRTAPWLPIVQLAKTAIDALKAGKLTWEQWDRHRAFWSWCLLAAWATAVAPPPTIPEARAALDSMIADRF